MPTPTEIADAAAVTAADGVASATTDGNSATAMDPLKQLEVADKLAARALGESANPNGGKRSGWAGLRPARVTPPGAV